MKKILSILTVLCICGISAFAQNTAPKENIMTDQKVLVAFFSRTGENYNVGNISKHTPQLAIFVNILKKSQPLMTSSKL